MATASEQIENAALEILAQSPEGVRFSDLWRRVHLDLPHVKEGTVFSIISEIGYRRPNEVTKLARGLYCLSKFAPKTTGPDPLPDEPPAVKIKELQFYEPFAEWIVGELEECTKAVPLGGNIFGGKWGTPDVIGIRKSKASDIIKFETEIVSAEVKLDTSWLIGAFGQACAYRLFSHKSYLVVPATSPEADLARLDALGRIFGIGLILFDPADPQKPEFQIRVRAASQTPDMFYVNKCLKLVEDQLFS